MEDTRLKVRCPNGQVAALERTLSERFCTVQLKGHEYYRVMELDRLEPISDEEYRRAK